MDLTVGKKTSAVKRKGKLATGESGLRVTLKRGFDVVTSLMGLVFLGPLFLAIALLVKISSPGPVFYRGPRIGKAGQPFLIYKFRTMTEQPDRPGLQITAQDDPRITPVGRVLRKTKLNELPQLINVLRGEMSLVGPRPEDPQYVALYTPEQRRVLSVLPGITSLASIIYRDEESMLNQATLDEIYVNVIMPDKLRLDLEYIKHQSFLVDLDILFHTVLVLLPLMAQSTPDVEEILFGPVRRFIQRYLSWFILDVGLAFVSFASAIALWCLIGDQPASWREAWVCILPPMLIYPSMNQLFGLPQSMWRYASAQEIVTIFASVATGTVLLELFVILRPLGGFPPSGWVVLASSFTFAAFVVARYRGRLITGLFWWCNRLLSNPSPAKERVLIVGAGETGQLFAWQVLHRKGGQRYQIVAFVDDDPDKRGMRIHGIPILGNCQKLPTLVAQQRVDLVAIASSSVTDERLREIVSLCEKTHARVTIIPDVLHLIHQPDEFGLLAEQHLRASTHLR